MPATIICPHCGERLRLAERLYEREAQCPCCDGAFAVRWRPGEPPPDANSQSAPTRRRPCRFCGKPIEYPCAECPHCRERFGE
jgi:hypothetical protein